MIYTIIIFFIFIFTVWMLIEGQSYEIKRIKIRNDKIPKSFRNFKIIFLSDIHYGKFFKTNRLIEVVNEINRLEPDIVIIGGDYLDIPVESKRNMKKYIDIEFSILSKLKAKRGIYTVVGNHDYFLGKALIMEQLESNSFKLLLNDKEKICIGNDYIEIIGIDDLLEGKPNTSLLKEDSKSFSIAVSHNPDFFGKFKNAINYDLGLSGHTHGGQVTFFGLYAPYTSSKYGQKYIRKVIKEGNRTILVSYGIGNGSLPIRFFAKPDFLEITLKK